MSIYESCINQEFVDATSGPADGATFFAEQWQKGCRARTGHNDLISSVVGHYYSARKIHQCLVV